MHGYANALHFLDLRALQETNTQFAAVFAINAFLVLNLVVLPRILLFFEFLHLEPPRLSFVSSVLQNYSTAARCVAVAGSDCSGFGVFRREL